MSFGEESELQELRVTPGRREPYDVNTYGEFVVLVVNSFNTYTNNTEKIGIAVPYSYIQNSSAELAAKSVSLDEVGNYLNKITIPEVWNNQTNILQSNLYLAISILTEEQANYLIQEHENEFYLPYQTALAVIANDALGSNNVNKYAEILKSLTYYLKGQRLEWDENVETFVPLNDDGSIEYSNVISENVRVDNNPYFLHPVITVPEDERNVTNINECYLISNDKKFAATVISNPNYCTLVHNPNYVEFVEFALPLLCKQEVREVVTNNISPNPVYLFSLSELDVPLFTSGNIAPLNSVQESLNLLDYYAGFPCHKLNLNGAYMTGDWIPACVHGVIYDEDYDSTNEYIKIYSGVQKINVFYPEVIIDTSDVSHINIKLLTGNSPITIHEDPTKRKVAPDAFEVISNVSGRSIPLLLHWQYGPKLKILVEEGNLNDRVEEYYQVVLEYYPNAELERHGNAFKITGAHRQIKISYAFNSSAKRRILSQQISATRGWVTDVNGTRDIVLSSTCLYTALHLTLYNYYVRDNLVKSRKYQVNRVTKYYLRGYKRAVLDPETSSEDIKENVKVDTEYYNKQYGRKYPFGLFNQVGSDETGISNILYRIGEEDILRKVFPELYSSRIPVSKRQGR